MNVCGALVEDTGGGILSRVRNTLYSVGGRWINVYRSFVEWEWQVKTKVLCENLCCVCCRWMSEYGWVVEWYGQWNPEILVEKYYTVCVVGEIMYMLQWWNVTDRESLKYLENNYRFLSLINEWLLSSIKMV